MTSPGIILDWLLFLRPFIISAYEYQLFSRMAGSWHIMQKVCFLLEHCLVNWRNSVSSQVCLCRCSGFSCIMFFETLYFQKSNPTKRPAELRNMGRKYTRMQLGKMEANKSVLHLDFIKRKPPFFHLIPSFSGCILILDAFQGIWTFCKS